MVNLKRPRKDLVLKDGENIVFLNEKRWEPGVVVSRHNTPRSYWVRNENNNVIRRNTIHLRKSMNAPQIQTPDFSVSTDESMKSPIRSNSSPQNVTEQNNTQVALGSTFSRDVAGRSVEQPSYTTRYGRNIKRPDFFKPS